MKIRKGDEVYVLAGKFRGERANVEEALPGANKVILDGLTSQAPHQAGRLDHASRHHRQVDALDASNVALWCDGHKGPAKVGYKTEDGVKHRICRKCGEAL